MSNFHVLARILSITLLCFSSTIPLVVADTPAAQSLIHEESPVRLFPEETADLLERLSAGQEVKVLQTAEAWSLIEYTKDSRLRKGWVRSSHLTPAKTLSVPTTAPAAKSTSERAQELKTNPLKSESRDPYESGEVSSDASYAFLFPTALHRPVNTTSARGAYFTGWGFDRTFATYSTAGLHLLAPIGILGGGIHFKQSMQLAPSMHVGITGAGGGLTALWTSNNSNSAMYYAVGSMITLGDQHAAVTVGPYLLGGQANSSNYNHIFLTNVNAHYRFNEMVKGILDFILPIATNYQNVTGDWSAIMYGIRAGGERISGDIGFAIPITDEMGDLMRVMPLGIPFIALNFYW